MNLNEAYNQSPLLLESHREIFDRSGIKVLIAYGKQESPAFKKQAEDYFQLLRKSNFKSLDLIGVENCDHFNVIENISQDDFSLTKEIYKLMDVKSIGKL